jgi:hypothetical protein
MDMDMDIPPIHYTAPLPSSAIQRTLNDVALFFIGTLTGTVLGRFMLYIENKYHLTSPESIFILGMLQLVLYSLALQTANASFTKLGMFGLGFFTTSTLVIKRSYDKWKLSF